ncbi:5-methylcytosine restriction system specificity protein McrC [Sulfurovum sp. CS9]|uniref:5-methylcytosine restriction system specificity protein McrC n=1 Tax=Sulfurovum sp. CS9 TaxID=3391146 RepID=UPI0039ED356E
MEKHVIAENSKIRINHTDIEIAKELLEETDGAYFSIDGENIVFKPYIVGEIRIGDTYILINPRHEAYGISDIFAMATYIDTGSLNSSSLANNYESGDYGVETIYVEFIAIVKKLVNYGLTGDFQTKHNFSHSVSGDLDFEKYVRQTVPMTGIPNVYQNYDINTRYNQLIKSAIKKMLTQVDDTSKKELLHIFEYYKNIDEVIINEDLLDKKDFVYYGTNPHYDLALEYAYAILKNLKIKYHNGSIEYYSFLYNSNNLFEEYILVILKSEKKFAANKWMSPKPFALIEHKSEESIKSYSPDILINYVDSLNGALAVFDVKNKFFNPDTVKLSDSVNNGDIYQLLFYFARLKTSVGGLIYPAKKRYEPIRMVLGDYSEEMFFVSIDMSKSLKDRHDTLINDIISIIR